MFVVIKGATVKGWSEINELTETNIIGYIGFYVQGFLIETTYKMLWE